MTTAERKVRERYPDAECERTVAAYVLGEGFRVYAYGDSRERWIIGRGATPETAWADAALDHFVPPVTMEREP